ncbi:unnamed protein product [Paramecium octaurelia]|uniref:CHY-type domain-containing protein n=1 Tax=Paramecium octaurelia TaxID=43137 RepID=A0A8S1T8R2_PAROT|nr:unnamed protein product [Paramecium octaurelia]
MKKQSSHHSKTEPSIRKSNKTPTSPIINLKTEDQLTQSQINYDFLKTQQSFRSSASPQAQNSSLSSKATYSAKTLMQNNQKKQMQILSKQRMQNMHERSIIKVMGLNMEAICHRRNHENNKMLYFCQYPDCKADSRIGCSYCLVEQHSDHSTQIMEVQTFCKLFDDKKKQFMNLSESILKPPDKTPEIKFYFDQLKQYLLDRLFFIEKNVLQSMNQQLEWNQLEKELLNQIISLGSKNIYEMSQDELKESLDFIQGKHLQELEQMKQETNHYLGQKISQVEKAWNEYKKQLEVDLSHLLDENNKLVFLDPQSKEFLEYKLNFYEQKEKKVKEMRQPYFTQLEVIKEEEQYQQETLKKIMSLQNSDFNLKDEEIKKEKDKVTKAEQFLKQQKEIKQREKEKEKQREREKLLLTFPYKIYTEECGHRVQCNTIPIFGCCNKAYPCAKCHGNIAHPARIQVPSYRYCMKCLEIYLVMYPTNYSVNCLKCQK